MEYDSASNSEGRLRDIETSEDPSRLSQSHKTDHLSSVTNSKPWSSLHVASSQPPINLGTTNRNLSSQVMEYYQKYSQSSNLDQYFSLPATSSPPEAVKYFYSIYELNPKLGANRQDCIGEEYNLKSYIPRERRRWVRPPLIGQSSNGEGSSRYIRPLTDPHCPSPDLKRVTPDAIPEEKNDTQESLAETSERKLLSPTSSIASHKPLEWDSGADVGYYNTVPNSKQCSKKLSTIERMALARGCSAALRLDPEGTTESGISGKIVGSQKSIRSSMIPDANSTPFVVNASGSESEIEITPIVKNHLPGIITGSDIKSEDRNSTNKGAKQTELVKQSPRRYVITETPKSSFTFKMPCVKPPAQCKKLQGKHSVNKETMYAPLSPLKKSTSMNTLVVPCSKLSLKRSQSDLNLHAKEKNKPPIIFNSSSSIATIVNKPTTCDKVIQTSFNAFSQESIGVQVSVAEEEKPPLPKRGTSLQKSLQPILKNAKGTYKVRDSKKQENSYKQQSLDTQNKKKECKMVHTTHSEQSQNGSITPRPDDTGNITGRANSFEYFPGHIYENVPNGSGSHVSSSDTGRSNSTLPNTSSSINEKLWGDSDSLIKDLERSVNILKSLVDANECDKEVKKRLIHHVVRRLMVAKYTDDKIEHNLEDNVPWNPENTRSKVYRSKILQALSKKHSTSDSSEGWNQQTQNTCTRNPLTNSRELMKEVTLESSNSDKFDKNIDRTKTDGRKARMGDRADDRQPSSNTTTDPEKSESSECFLPRGRKNNKVPDIFGLKEKCKIPSGDTTTSSTLPDHNRMLLEAVVNNRRTTVTSSNNSEQNIDWRLFPTMSERQFELKKRSNSDSGDSKLVSYAEMEKRNQLIWITNEISHLCNLKKLLEQSRKPERPRASPRKAKPSNYKPKPMSVLGHSHGCSREVNYISRNALDDGINSMEEPWSSHCNLAAYRPTTSTTNSIIQRVRKRNSCAQTATNVTSAHSKTGGEIVSASNLQNSTTELVNVGVQTLPQEALTIPTLIQSEIVHYIKCPAHKTMMHFQKNSTDSICQCHHHTAQSVITACMSCSQEQKQGKTVGNCAHKTHLTKDYQQEEKLMVLQTPVIQTSSSSPASSEGTHQCVTKENGQFKQKEAKNQLNASKSKCTYECKKVHAPYGLTDCRCGINGVDGKSIEHNRVLPKLCQLCSISESPTGSRDTVNKCEEYSQKKISCVHEKKERNATSKCTCTNIYSVNVNNGYTSTYNQNNSASVYECGNDSPSCENTREKTSVCHDCHLGNTVQHNEIHHCRCCPKIEEKQNHLRHSCKRTIQHNENPRQYETQNGVKCNCEKDCSCIPKTKGADDKLHNRVCSNKVNHAHENNVSDSERNYKYCQYCGALNQNAKKCNCQETYRKAVAYELSFTMPKVPLANQNGGKPDGCACNVIKRNSNSTMHQKNSLQDYLSRNKPEFVGNAETRRQYMSEISHLRELRKEKWIQLLAMASTSNTKTPKLPVKPTGWVQRKMTHEEMKERLRKRYLRLNEVRTKKRQQEKEEGIRRNKLMAKIYGKKLQQKVLRGQVDLSRSFSVISNI